MIDDQNRSADERSNPRGGAPVSDGPDGRIICPECLNAVTHRAPRRHYREIFLLLRRPYLCETCGLVFEAPCGLSLCALASAMGATFAVLIFALCVVPSVSGLLTSGFTFTSAVDFILGVFGSGGGLWIVFVAIRTAIRSRRYRRRVSQGTAMP